MIPQQSDETVAVHDAMWPQRVRIISDKLHDLWAEEYHGRIECGTALALEPERVKVSGGRWRIMDEDGRWQTVNGACTCADYKGEIPGQPAAPKGFCTHRCAAMIVRDAQALAEEALLRHPETVDQETGEVCDGAPARAEEKSAVGTEDEDPATSGGEEAPTTIPPEYLQYIHGKPHVLYKGLLAMAHAKGLVSLEARLTVLQGQLAVAEAKATFKDGSFFVESADATEANISHVHIKPHFRRMALTRAKARALRDALNVGMVALEEL
jgi:hypothetical protein